MLVWSCEDRWYASLKIVPHREAPCAQRAAVRIMIDRHTRRNLSSPRPSSSRFFRRLGSVGSRRSLATVLPDRAIRCDIRDERSAEIASTVAAVFRQVHDDGTKSVEVRLVVHLPPVALDMEETGPRQNCQMRRHRILGDLASSGDVTRPDRSPGRQRRAGEMPPCGCPARARQGLNGSTLIDESRHADPLIENQSCAQSICPNFSTHEIENCLKEAVF